MADIKALVVAEHDNKSLKDATAKTVTAAAQVSAPVHILVAGQGCDAVAQAASKLAIEGESVSVTREVDGGLQTVKLKGPAIVTTDLRLNEPRYASLPNIMKAKKKPIADKTPADYGVDVAPRLEVVKTTEPSGRKAGVKVKTVGELIDKLKNEAGVL